MQNPVVSVLMPVKNGERFILQGVGSVLAQSYSSLELIVIDDHSTDGTTELLRNVSDSRLRLIPSAGHGLPTALNTGLDAARGRLVARLDADDIAEVGRLEAQVARMEEDATIALLGTQVARVDERGGMISTSNLPQRHQAIMSSLVRGYHAIAHTSVMFRSTSVRYQDRPAEDWAFFFDMSRQGLLENLSETLVRYRFHGESVNSTKLLAHRRDMHKVIRSTLNKPDPSHGFIKTFAELNLRREVLALSAYRRAQLESNRSRARALALQGYGSMLYPEIALTRAARTIQGRFASRSR